jgi:hypothetical protein
MLLMFPFPKLVTITKKTAALILVPDKIPGFVARKLSELQNAIGRSFVIG